jgi:glycosyltransferase involved in cell wall biosynthesis
MLMERRSSIAALGVVIIGRNEGERLVACLRSVAPLGLPMVYVDSASTDHSREVARAACAQVVELDLSSPFTAARARNEGAAALIRRAPSLRYVQFVDGDCEIVSGWIDKAKLVLDSRPEVVAVCGQRSERYPDRSFYNRLCNKEWNTPVGEALACGGDAMMRVAAFMAVGGFDDSMIAHEEPELCARLRNRKGIILRIDEPMTLHDANIMRFSQWWRRNVRAGFGYAQAAVRAPGYPKSEIALLRRALIWSLIPLPIAITLLLGWSSIAIALFLLYPLQFARLSLRERSMGYPLAFKTAALSLIGKFAETLGAMKCGVDMLFGRRRGAILYR